MSYLVLARRWRPQKFSDLVGQDVVVRTLKNALLSGNLAHAYLLCGIRGVGKTTIARLMAMAVNCTASDSGEPCGECAACSSIAAGANLDVQEMDAASHTGVDDVREILDGVRYPPTSLKTKVYIIDEAHMLSKSAFNALLKTLEEPPEHVLFILATTESEKLPVTVRSRCQRFDLRRLGQSEISDYLKHVFQSESIRADDDALVAIAQAADGSVRDALSLAERVLAYSREHLKAVDVMSALGLVGYALNRSLCEAVFAGDAAMAVKRLRDALAKGYGARSLLLELSRLWHQLACLQADSGLLESEIDAEHRAWLQQQFGRLTAQALDLRYQVLLQGMRDLALVDERMGAEMVLMRLCGLNAISAVEKSTVVTHTDAATEAKKTEAKRTEAKRTEAKRTEAKRTEAKKTEASPAFTDIRVADGEQSNAPAAVAAEKITKQPVEQTIEQSIEQTIKQSADASAAKSVDQAIEKPTDDLPLHEQAPVGGQDFTTWQQAVDAFGAIKPGVSAMLDHVLCLDFDDKVRLALDKHQQRAIAAADRLVFSEWLGREVLWESRQQQQGDSLSQKRAKQARAEEVRLRKGAEDDPHVQALMREMDAKLIKVLPAGVSDEK
ncbi:MAG: DNA polymerase III subunit gamma/tau [Mariprofundus sp.]|nr:DNA polymerase III subunit gamma/tau [Mariprofundus sp.]